MVLPLALVPIPKRRRAAGFSPRGATSARHWDRLLTRAIGMAGHARNPPSCGFTGRSVDPQGSQCAPEVSFVQGSAPCTRDRRARKKRVPEHTFSRKTKTRQVRVALARFGASHGFT